MKVIAHCWSCNKEHDISDVGVQECNVKCDCGGYVISPTGKTYSRLIPETQAEKQLICRAES